MKKILVTKEWHKRALKVMSDNGEKVRALNAYHYALNSFLMTVLTPEQQSELESEIERFNEYYMQEGDQK